MSTKSIIHHNYLKLLGIGYAFIALIDLIHTLAYKGMNVFPGYGSNLPTQLWIAARYLQAVTLGVAPFFVDRRLNDRAILGGYATAVSVLVAMVFSGIFPDCYIEGKGLTPFKIISEYVITTILLASLFPLYREREYFDKRVFIFIVSSIACTAMSEISFTAYISVYGFANMVGHFFKLAAFYLIYRALLVTGLKEPFDLIFRELKQTKETLQKAHNNLAEQVRERTVHLEATNKVLEEEIAERNEAEQKIVQLAAIVESSDDAIIGKTLDGIITSWNKGAEKIYGYDESEIVGKPISTVVPRGHDNETPQILCKIKLGEHIEHYETVRQRKDGQYIHMSLTISPIRDAEGRIVGVSTIGRDITDRKRAEEVLCRLNRELRAISDCNQALLRAVDEQTLLNEICRIICEEAGYYMAWVGYAENNDARTVRPVAWAGVEDGYLATANITWADSERGCGPTGTAIRSGESICIQDFMTDPQAAPWRESALQRGYRSSIALPLKDENSKTFGVLNIYSTESNTFTPDETRLMEELAGDLSFGINVLRARTERKRVVVALRESETQVRHKLDAILSPEADIGALELTDIIDTVKIQKLMDEFYRLTNIGIGIIDLHGKVLVGTGWQDICTNFHRTNPESCRLCIESDLELSHNVPAGTFKQYKCKNNMWDIATPIMLGDKHVGNIFLGQFLFDDEMPDYDTFRQQAHQYGFNEQEYIAALDRVPRWSQKVVNAAMSFYTAFAGMIGNLSYANIKLANALDKRKRSEDQIQHLKNYLANIIDSMPSILVGMDNNQTVSQWNRQAEEMTGISVTEAIGKPITHLFPDFSPWIAAMRSEIEQHRPASMEKLLIEKEGERRFYDLMLYPLLTNGVEGAVIRIEDVTERARIQELMIQTEKMMSVGGLAAGMAHEINNPLGIITQAIQNIERRVSPDLAANRKVAEELGVNLEGIEAYFKKRQMPQFIGSIRTASSRAAKIVANMLQFSRRAETTMQYASLSGIMDQALELAASDYDLKKKYDFRSIEIIRDYTDIPEVNIVSVEIEQVMLNLLKNAAQAMIVNPPDRNPRIILRLRREDRYVLLEVEDNGSGMEEDIRRRVFEPFFTTKEPGIGTGLGLSVAYMIVTQNHKGLMEVISTPGRGSINGLRDCKTTYRIYRCKQRTE